MRLRSAAAIAFADGPERLIVSGDRARSAYGLARIEVKLLAENPAKK